ncbi:MAG: GNAT family N-acetyltransferase [Armatimonadetes bacterium]|nr:GNAT family N-acetyltransferase [Armatimonadota bacterium]
MSDSERYFLDQMETFDLRRLCRERKESFYAWIRAMTPELDNEEGTGPGSFEEWLREHETIPDDITYVFYDRATGWLLGTASIIARDRDVAAEPGGWMLGGVNVVRECRQRGIGGCIMQHMDACFQRRADEAGRPVPITLYTAYEPAICIYRRFGYEPTGERTASHIPTEESLGFYRKVYLPEQR